MLDGAMYVQSKMFQAVTVLRGFEPKVLLIEIVVQ